MSRTGSRRRSRPTGSPSTRTGLLADLWFAAFDGGTDGDPAALLAREEGDSYRGFWTFRPPLVTDILDNLRSEVVPRMA